SIEVSQAALTLNQHFAALRDEISAAKEANRELYKYNTTLASLNRLRDKGTLGQQRYNTELAKLKEQLSLGSINAKSYQQKVKELDNELKKGSLNAKEYQERLKELGSDPGPLSFRQIDLIRNPAGAASLNTQTFAGAENTKAIISAL